MNRGGAAPASDFRAVGESRRDDCHRGGLAVGGTARRDNGCRASLAARCIVCDEETRQLRRLSPLHAALIPTLSSPLERNLSGDPRRDSP